MGQKSPKLVSVDIVNYFLALNLNNTVLASVQSKAANATNLVLSLWISLQGCFLQIFHTFLPDLRDITKVMLFTDFHTLLPI